MLVDCEHVFLYTLPRTIIGKERVELPQVASFSNVAGCQDAVKEGYTRVFGPT